jgi:hypothetical protein
VQSRAALTSGEAPHSSSSNTLYDIGIYLAMPVAFPAGTNIRTCMASFTDSIVLWNSCARNSYLRAYHTSECAEQSQCVVRSLFSAAFSGLEFLLEFLQNPFVVLGILPGLLCVLLFLRNTNW